MNVCWQESCAFRMHYGILFPISVSCCIIIVGLMIFVSSLTVEVTLSLERNEVCAKESLFLTCDFL